MLPEVGCAGRSAHSQNRGVRATFSSTRDTGETVGENKRRIHISVNLLIPFIKFLLPLLRGGAACLK